MITSSTPPMTTPQSEITKKSLRPLPEDIADADGTRVIDSDPWLEPFREDLKGRYETYLR